MSNAFEDVCALGQIPDGGAFFVELGGREILLTRSGEKVNAFSGRCTHAFASLSGGRIEGGEIVCSQHGARFDLLTGKARFGGCPDLPRYAVKVSGGRVFVSLR